MRIGTVYLLEKTPWGEALELSKRDFFLEIIAGDINVVAYYENDSCPALDF